MAQLLELFDAAQVAPKQGGAPQMPLGKHPVVIVASSVEATAKGDGGYLKYELQIIDGPNRGEAGVLRVNLYSANEKARAFAQGQQSALCHVTGVFKFDNTEALHNKPFVVDVGNSKLTDEQKTAQLAGQVVEPFTEVKKILDMNGNEPGKAPSQQHQQPAAQQNQQPHTAAQGQPAQQGWGQPAAQNTQPAQQQQPAQAWGGQAQQPAAQQQQPAQSWQQGNPAPAQGGAPAGGMPWGQK